MYSVVPFYHRTATGHANLRNCPRAQRTRRVLTHHAVGHTPPPASLRMTRLWLAALAVSGCAISISVRDRAAALTDHTRAAPGAWRATSFPPEHSTSNTPSTHGGKNCHGRELDAAHCGGDGNGLIVSFPAGWVAPGTLFLVCNFWRQCGCALGTTSRSSSSRLRTRALYAIFMCNFNVVRYEKKRTARCKCTLAGLERSRSSSGPKP